MIYSYLVMGALLLFGALGFWRGWLREIATLAGLLLCWMLLVSIGETFVSFVNRVQMIVVFVVRDGFDAGQPGALIQAIRRHPLVDPRHPDFFLGVLLAILTVALFLAANRFVAPAAGWSSQALGALVGLANGYLLTYLAFRYFAPSARINLAVSVNPSSVGDGLGQYLPTVLVAGVILAIGIALLSSRRLSPRAGSRAPGRSRG